MKTVGMVRTSVVAITLLASDSTAALSNKICPLLGASFPAPSKVNQAAPFRSAVRELSSVLNNSVTTGETPYGPTSINSSTFSVGLFNTHDTGLLYEYHFTGAAVEKSPVGVHKVDGDTIYRIGSQSKLLTVYAMLIKFGDRCWNSLIADILPELKNAPTIATSADVQTPRWDEITVGDLTCHMAGLAANYGLGDVGYPFETAVVSFPGLPSLPTSQLALCGWVNASYAMPKPCTEEEYLKGVQSESAIFAPSLTPAYSNNGFELLGLIATRLAGVPFEEIFNESIVQPLKLQSTTYSVPQAVENGAIPVNETISGWNTDLGVAVPAGGNFASTSDLAAIGKAILSSSMLSKSQTRRWMKPKTFTADAGTGVGSPWEIYRVKTRGRYYDLYTKDGSWGMYNSIFVLVPDLDFGFTVLSAAPSDGATTVELITELMAATVLPAFDEIARTQASERFAGSYSSTESKNTTVSVTVDSQPGLRVTSWRVHGVEMLRELGGGAKGTHTDFRLWPNELYSGNLVGFTGTWQVLPRPKVNVPISQSCQAWESVSTITYGNVDIGQFVFDVDSTTGRAKMVKSKAFREVLRRTE